MDRPKFTKICRAAMTGDDKYLKNTASNRSARLISCLGDKAEVEICGRHETWARSDCQEFSRQSDDYRI